MHSASRLTFGLDPKFRRFEAEAAIHDVADGAVAFKTANVLDLDELLQHVVTVPLSTPCCSSRSVSAKLSSSNSAVDAGRALPSRRTAVSGPFRMRAGSSSPRTGNVGNHNIQGLQKFMPRRDGNPEQQIGELLPR